MAFQPCPDTAEIRITAILNGQIIENVMHCRVGTTPTSGDLDTVRDTVNDWVLGPYATHLSANVLFQSIVITDLNVAGGGQSTQDLIGQVGLVDSAVKTNQDTFVVKLLTGHAGRSFRGRQYIMGVPTSYFIDPNHLSGTAVGLYTAMYNSLREDLNTAGFPLGVLSRYSGVDVDHKPIPRTNGLLTDVTSVAATDDIVDSQNRRLPGRGI